MTVLELQSVSNGIFLLLLGMGNRQDGSVAGWTFPQDEHPAKQCIPTCSGCCACNAKRLLDAWRWQKRRSSSWAAGSAYLTWLQAAPAGPHLSGPDPVLRSPRLHFGQNDWAGGYSSALVMWYPPPAWCPVWPHSLQSPKAGPSQQGAQNRSLRDRYGGTFPNGDVEYVIRETGGEYKCRQCLAKEIFEKERITVWHNSRQRERRLRKEFDYMVERGRNYRGNGRSRGWDQGSRQRYYKDNRAITSVRGTGEKEGRKDAGR